MCTAINDNRLFGRTLDVERSFGEQVVITPRSFAFNFLHQGSASKHYAIIGAAHVVDNTPLYYDAMNEKGLCAAALRLPELTTYHEARSDKDNLASFELIPWLLCNYETAEDARKAMKNVNITPESFSKDLPSTPLHWLVGDRKTSFVIESVEDGLKIYDNPYCVLTNAPEFPTQCYVFEERGRPMLGDLSSSSRFVRAINAKDHTDTCDGEIETISRFFHIMSTVNQPAGLFQADERTLRTEYTACMDTETLTYYFTTYDCRNIRGVKMRSADLDGTSLAAFPMNQAERIDFLN
ncbi:MAG: linear amide C-N hydrolase [Clostridia bacterium]|nr:linear amide C-N hydrolase [Clostridia bacterium]